MSEWVVCRRVVCEGQLFLMKKAIFSEDWLPVAKSTDLQSPLCVVGFLNMHGMVACLRI